MWSRTSLRFKVMFFVAALTALCLGGGVLSLWFTFQLNSLSRSMVDENLAALEAAEELNNALVMQKGYLTYYFQDNDPAWLVELKKQDSAFKAWLNRARRVALQQADREILDQIDSEYLAMTSLRNQVIDYYKAGEREKGFELHQDARSIFFEIRDLTYGYKKINQERIYKAQQFIAARAGLFNKLSLAAMVIVVFLGALLAFILIRQVLGPIRQLADKAYPAETDRLDEVRALKKGVDYLLEDVDQTKSQLRLSQEHLIEASKLASVGKLAAGVAHSIRNPLTSVKMRLFSLERSQELTELQKEDFEVISEEIHQIDKIVGNFLEFSRRPKLEFQQTSPSDLVDLALDVLCHRLDSAGVQVEVDRPGRLPEIAADPEQLKEALFNLIVNACEAMSAERSGNASGQQDQAGRIVITEAEASIPGLGQAITIRISDNGPGLSPEIKNNIFQPFFTTKDEGTGLGLSIAFRIVEEHGGRLEVESNPGEGATFEITLPLKGTAKSRDAGPGEEDASWAKS